MSRRLQRIAAPRGGRAATRLVVAGSLTLLAWSASAAGARTPSLPDMTWRHLGAGSDYLRDLRRWVGDPEARARLIDPDEDGVPEAIYWYDTDDRLIQRWVDENGDGRADQVVIYRDGRPHRIVRADP